MRVRFGVPVGCIGLCMGGIGKDICTLCGRCVVFAPSAIRNFGFHHIGYKQDIQKALLILKHRQAQTHYWPVLQILLETYQLYSGLPSRSWKIQDHYYGAHLDG